MKTTNRQTVNYQKTLDKSNKGPVYRIHKELSQLNIKKQKHQNGQKMAKKILDQGNGPQALEEVFNIISHQGNENLKD